MKKLIVRGWPPGFSHHLPVSILRTFSFGLLRSVLAILLWRNEIGGHRFAQLPQHTQHPFPSSSGRRIWGVAIFLLLFTLLSRWLL